MKSYYITIVLAAAAMNINAQLVVDSLGSVEFTPPQNSSGPVNGYSTTIRPLINGGVLVRRPDNDYNGSSCGVNVNINGNGPSTSGILSYANGGLIYAYGVKGTAAPQNGHIPSPVCFGVFGGLNTPSSALGAGIYGSTTTLPSQASSLNKLYAGFFNGDVRVTGTIYGTVLSPITPFNPREGNMTILDEGGENRVTDRLLNVEVLQTQRINNNGSMAANKELKTLEVPKIDKCTLTEEQLMDLEEIEKRGVEEPIQTKLSAISYGLDAEQMKAVYPELVYEDNEGNYSINYTELIPLLVQCIKELTTELAELKGTSPRTAKAPTDATAIEKSVADVDMVRMDQNKPNPFSESTVIALGIPSNAQAASIFIYDMSGKQVQSFPVSERGETNITIYASDLTAGMYIYTLVIDGKAAVTRRMIITKK